METLYKFISRSLHLGFLGLVLAAATDGYSDRYKSRDFSYTLDSSFILLDKLKRPDTSGFNPHIAEITNEPLTRNLLGAVDSNNPRTLGLRHLKIDLNWLAIRSSRFRLTLRPDAETSRNTEDIPREFDTRSGNPYQPMARIQLIDSYGITLIKGEDLEFELGVFESLSPVLSSYHQTLGFGLSSLLPEKFLAIRITYNLNPPIAIESAKTSKVRSTYSLFVYEGDGDRGEMIKPSASSHDRSTVAEDPYMGMALQATFYPSSVFEYGASLGYGDTKLERGKKNEMYGVLNTLTYFKLFSKLSKFVLDSRFSRERWTMEVVRYAELLQHSHSLTFMRQLAENDWLALGYHYGVSQRHLETDTTKMTSVSGWQLDAGYVREMAANTRFSFFTAYEQRRTFKNSRKIGSFKNGGETSPNLMRVGFEVHYLLMN